MHTQIGVTSSPLNPATSDPISPPSSPLGTRNRSRTNTPFFSSALPSPNSAFASASNTAVNTPIKLISPHRLASTPSHITRSRTNPTSDARRNVFLNRVRQSRQDSVFEARSEQFQMLEYFADRRREREKLERSAPAVGPDDVEVEEMEADEAALRELIAEDQKLQSFVDNIEQEGMDDPMGAGHNDSPLPQMDLPRHEQQRHQLQQHGFENGKGASYIDEDDDEVFADLILNDDGCISGQQHSHGHESMDVD